MIYQKLGGDLGPGATLPVPTALWEALCFLFGCHILEGFPFGTVISWTSSNNVFLRHSTYIRMSTMKPKMIPDFPIDIRIRLSELKKKIVAP